VRNSSLVERDCAENVTGLKLGTETRDLSENRKVQQVVGERPASGEGIPARCVGVGGSEDAGISSANEVRTLIAECLRFPTEGQSASG
jgi:hypothetical protein